jgi:hypothetical protein
LVSGELVATELEGDARKVPVYPNNPAEALDAAPLGDRSGQFQDDADRLSDLGQVGRRLRLLQSKEQARSAHILGHAREGCERFRRGENLTRQLNFISQPAS